MIPKVIRLILIHFRLLVHMEVYSIVKEWVIQFLSPQIRIYQVVIHLTLMLETNMDLTSNTIIEYNRETYDLLVQKYKCIGVGWK